MITLLKQAADLAAGMQPKKRIYVAAADEAAALESCALAYSSGLADITLAGDEKAMKKLSEEHSIDLSGLEIIDISDEKQALKICLEHYREGRADILMKGKISTGSMMQGALRKEYGLRTERILSHQGIFEYNGRLVILSDAGMNIAPGISRKAGIIENAVQTANALGIMNPRVAILAAVEKIQLQAMPATRDGIILQRMNERGEIPGCRVQGPLSLDIALSEHAAQTKGASGAAAGRADILIVPDIEAGNVIYKSVTTIAEKPIAGILTGTKTPMIIISRADSTESKLYSVAICVYLAHIYSQNQDNRSAV